LVRCQPGQALNVKELRVYAIFEDGGKQYKVSSGDFLLVERRDLPEGESEITFDKVLMVGEGEDARIGTPWVEGATVAGRVVNELKMPKIHGLKFKRRKGYVKRWGHRQKMLRVQIGTIHA
jgi:large subunit ribosomal protein L21